MDDGAEFVFGAQELLDLEQGIRSALEEEEEEEERAEGVGDSVGWGGGSTEGAEGAGVTDMTRKGENQGEIKIISVIRVVVGHEPGEDEQLRIGTAACGCVY